MDFGQLRVSVLRWLCLLSFWWMPEVSSSLTRVIPQTEIDAIPELFYQRPASMGVSRLQQPSLDFSIQLRFLTRKNLQQPKTILLGASPLAVALSSVGRGHYDPGLPTKIIIHGFVSRGWNNDTAATGKWWTETLAESILNVDNANVILVNWAEGALFPYDRAVSNAWTVGAALSHVVNQLTQLQVKGERTLHETFQRQGTAPARFHLIGMSLGAHIAGYVGQRVPRLERITALDAAAPLFHGSSLSNRIDSGDALYVDSIHTDISELGESEPIGHASFYPNGGVNQPGCLQGHERVSMALLRALGTNGIERAANLIACDHSRALEYFMRSFDPNRKYIGYRCPSYNQFTSGRCSMDCSVIGQCAEMGYHADPRAKGVFYLMTNGENPSYSHLVTVRAQGEAGRVVKGDVDISLYLFNSPPAWVSLTSLKVWTNSSQVSTRTAVVQSASPIHQKSLVSTVTFTHNCSLTSGWYAYARCQFATKKLNIKSVRVLSPVFEQGHTLDSIFCPSRTSRPSQRGLYFLRKTSGLC